MARCPKVVGGSRAARGVIVNFKIFLVDHWDQFEEEDSSSRNHGARRPCGALRAPTAAETSAIGLYGSNEVPKSGGTSGHKFALCHPLSLTKAARVGIGTPVACVCTARCLVRKPYKVYASSGRSDATLIARSV